MQIRSKFFFVTIVCLISACDNEPAKSKIKNPLAGHVEALEKAKNVEKQLLERNEKILEKSN